MQNSALNGVTFDIKNNIEITEFVKEVIEDRQKSHIMYYTHGDSNTPLTLIINTPSNKYSIKEENVSVILSRAW